MSNVVEITLRVNAAVDGGLKRAEQAIAGFSAGLQRRAQVAADFNRSISNGDAAIRRWAAGLGALVSVGALRQFEKDAEAAEKAQQQLSSTLARAGNSGALAGLNAQSAALQRVTAFSDEAISDVQRLLVSFGATATQAQSMTEAVLDFATATGQSAEAAAMLVGRTLKGDSEELGRYNIALDSTKSRVVALTDALEGFARGAARGAVADKRARAATVETGEAAEQAGRAVLRVHRALTAALAPALTDMAGALERASVGLQSFIQDWSGLITAFAQVALASVSVVAIGKGLAAVINPLRVALAWIVGAPFGPTIASLQVFSRELGLLQTMQLANWGQRTAAAFAVVGAGIVGFALGKMIGDALNRAEEEVRRRVKAIRDSAFVAPEQIQGGIDRATTQKQIDDQLALARARKAAVQADIAPLAAREAMPSSRAGNKLGTKDSARKAALEQELKFLNTILAVSQEVRDTDLQRTIAAAGAVQAAFDEAQVTRDRLRAEIEAGNALYMQEQQSKAERRDLFDLETRAIAAEAAGDTEQARQLNEQLATRKLLLQQDELGHENVQRRIAAEKAGAEAARTRAAHEQARHEQERTLSQGLGALQTSIAAIEADRFATTEEKQARILPLLDEENRLIAERIDLLEQELLLSPGDERRGQINDSLDTLRTKQATNRGQREATRPLGVSESIGADLTSWADTFGTKAQAIARIFTGPIKAGVAATRDVMNQLLGTTEFWSKKLGTIGGSIMGAITSAIADMFAQWIAGQIASFVLEKVFRKQRQAEVATELTLNTANAAMVSVGSFGTAAIVGIAALLAVMAMFGGFESGGYTGGTRGRAAGLVHGEEFVFSAEAVDAIGRGQLEQMHSAARSGAAPARGEGRGATGSGSRTTQIVLVDKRREAASLQRNSMTEAQVVSIMRRRKYQVAN